MNENFPKYNNKIAYYLNTDFVHSEESPKENEFNLETKKFNKASVNFESNSQKLKIFEQYFNCKLKKIKKRNKNRPTPFQIFLKEKEYIKSMKTLRIQKNINITKQNINLISNIKTNKNIILSSDKKIANDKLENFAIKNLSSTLYLNKIKNYREKNNYFDKNKIHLHNYFIKEKLTKENFNAQKSRKNIKNYLSIKLLDLISSNDKIYKKELLMNDNSYYQIKNNKKKNNFTNTFYNNKPNKNKKIFMPYRNLNDKYDFPSIYKRYNFTENSLQKNNLNILNIISNKNKVNIHKEKSKYFLTNKKDFGANKKSIKSNSDENEDLIIEPKNKIKFFINEKII